MPYPPRPQLRPLPAFAGTARSGTVLSQRLQAQLEAFVLGGVPRRPLAAADRRADRPFPNRGPPRARQAPGAAARRRRSTAGRPASLTETGTRAGIRRRTAWFSSTPPVVGRGDRPSSLRYAGIHLIGAGD